MQIIENDISTPSFGPSQNWKALSGPLLQRGTVTAGLVLSGNHDFTFADEIVGSVTMQGNGALTLEGNNTLSFLRIESGELHLATNQPIPSGQFFEMGEGTLLVSEGFHSCPVTLRLDGAVTYGGVGLLTLDSITQTGSGRLIVDTSGELRALGGLVTSPEVHRGTLIANRADADMLGGEVRVGDGVGPLESAVLRTENSGQLDYFTHARIREDGWLDIQNGDEVIDQLTMTGGRLTGGEVGIGFTFTTEASAQTATFEADWLVPPFLSFSVADGAPQVDLDVSGDVIIGSEETLTKNGAGTVRFSGGTMGANVVLDVEEGGVILETSDPNPSIFYATLSEGTVLTGAANYQFGPLCTVDMRAGSTLDLQAPERIWILQCDGGSVEGAGPLEVTGLIEYGFDSSDSSEIRTPVIMDTPVAELRCQGGARATHYEPVEATGQLLITGNGELLVSALIAPSMELSGIEFRAAALAGDLHQTSGVLSPDPGPTPALSRVAGPEDEVSLSSTPDPVGLLTVEGNWIQDAGDLRIEIDGDPASLQFDRLAVQDSVVLAGSLTVASLPGALYTVGERFPIITAGVALSGSFSAESLPVIPGGLELEVEINPIEKTVYLNVIAATSSVPDDSDDPNSPGDGGDPEGPFGPGAPGANDDVALRTLPNPTDGPVSITYSVLREGRVQIDLYDVAGRRVMGVLDQEQQPGTHVLQWEPRHDRGEIATGVYLLVVRSKGKTETRRVTRLR